jgi:hypothetical protein
MPTLLILCVYLRAGARGCVCLLFDCFTIKEILCDSGD